MGILKHLLFWPVTGPLWMTRFSLEQVDGAAQKELTDDEPVKEELLELQLRLELGEISEEDYEKQEAELMARMRETRRWRERLGMEPTWRPLGSSGEPGTEADVDDASDHAVTSTVATELRRDPSGPGPGTADGTAGLLGRLPRRFTFVVGRGGVGKTTTAGALALALADAGHRTHLLSTDPAHSLGDLFGLSPPTGEPSVSPCSPRLIIEELDAPRRGREWVRRLAQGVGELVELGTYLDADDVAGLIEPALPGLGELIAAVRLTELYDEGIERVVVDTAPSTPTFRLLECGRVLEGWVEALDAMAAKAGAVQERLLRRRIRLEGEAVLDELRARAREFAEGVLSSADFLVISRSDPFVRRETDRLVDRLETMGVRVSVRLETPGPGGTRGGAAGPRGCDDLRRWWMKEGWREGSGSTEGANPAGVVTAPPRSSTASGAASGEPHEEVLAHLRDRELVLFAGKGGVGKSTCAAACAVGLASERPVLLLGLDPAGSLADLLDGRLEEEEHLQLREVEPEREFEAFRERYRDEVRTAFERLGLDRAVPLDRRVMESLLGLAPPGLDEIFGLRVLLEGVLGPNGVQGGRVVVVDAAPTGHFLRLIEMPEPALAWAHAVMGLIRKYRSILGLEDLAPGLLEFARDLRALVELLRDPERTGVVVVTLDEPLVRSETERLIATLVEKDVPISLVLVNRYRSGARDDDAPPPGDGVSSAGLPVSIAPELSEPPTGSRGLGEFFSRWRTPG